MTYSGNLLSAVTMTPTNGDVLDETYQTTAAGLPSLVRKLNDATLIDLSTEEGIAGVHATVLGAAKVTYDVALRDDHCASVNDEIAFRDDLCASVRDDIVGGVRIQRTSLYLLNWV